MTSHDRDMTILDTYAAAKRDARLLARIELDGLLADLLGAAAELRRIAGAVQAGRVPPQALKPAIDGYDKAAAAYHTKSGAK